MNNMDVNVCKLIIGFPVYNGEQYINEALDSLLAQTYSNFEIVISDNCSTDRTMEICQNYAQQDDRIRYFRQAENTGAIRNFEYVLREGDSEYFMWAACDDIWAPTYIEECLLALASEPRVVLAFSNVEAINKRGKKYRDVPSFQKFSGLASFSTVFKYTMDAEVDGKANLIYGIFRRSYLRTVLLGDFWGADMCFNLSAIARGGVVIVDKVLYRKRNPNAEYNIFYRKNWTRRTEIDLASFKEYYFGMISSAFNTRYFLLVIVLMTYRWLEIFSLRLFGSLKRRFNYFLKEFLGLSCCGFDERRRTYSQSGEDVIVDYIFKNCGIKEPTYIDIGAHHPYHFNNTQIFYENGSFGINIEPNSLLLKDFVKHRKHDTNLNIGVSGKSGELDFYVMSSPTMSTFSSTVANDLVVEHGFKVVRRESVKVLTVQDVIQQYCGGLFPHFLSLDVEGLDLEILESIDFDMNYPIVICVETITYSTIGKGKKIDEIRSVLEGNGYILYADTNINSIFVKEEFWVRG